MSSLNRLLSRYLSKNYPSYALGTICLVATNYLGVAIPTQLGAALDGLANQTAMSHIINIAWMGVVVILVRTMSRVLFFNPGRDVEYQIRKDLFAHLLALPPSFYAKHNRGDIISRASNDISWIRALIGFGGLQVINLALVIVLTLGKMIDLSPKLTFLTIFPIVLGTFVVQYSIRKWYPLMKRNQEELAAISEHVLESFQGVATIQGFQAEPAFVREFQRRNQEWFDTGLHLKVMQASILPLVALAGGGSVFSVLYFGAPLIEQGLLTVGDVAVFIALIANIIPYTRSLGWMLSTWQSGRAAADRVFELLDAEIERPEGPNGVHLKEGEVPNIVVRNLSFAYPDAPEVSVLSDVNFTLQSGETMGVFGRTGSGKSTLLRILARMYAPQKEQVFIENVDICDLDILSWRRKISMVPQRPFLFSDSVKANIALDDESQPDKINHVVNLASLTQDLPALPKGLDTVVGERGIMLSGGQRQRVALARGLYHGGDLILLDDVLSAVDHENEQKLVQALSQLQEGVQPSCVIVSNRISAFRHAHHILVLDEGRVVAQGTHAELIQQSGVYQDAYRAQKEADHGE